MGDYHECNIKHLSKKFAGNFKPESEARWKDLVQFYKKCCPEEGSRDMNLLQDPICDETGLREGLAHFILNNSEKFLKIFLKEINF